MLSTLKVSKHSKSTLKNIRTSKGLIQKLKHFSETFKSFKRGALRTMPQCNSNMIRFIIYQKWRLKNTKSSSREMILNQSHQISKRSMLIFSITSPESLKRQKIETYAKEIQNYSMRLKKFYNKIRLIHLTKDSKNLWILLSTRYF